MLPKNARIILLTLSLTGVCAFAQPTNPPPGPPFYAYSAGIEGGGGGGGGTGVRPIPRGGRPNLETSPGAQADCYSSDGTIPAFVQAVDAYGYFGGPTFGLTSCEAGQASFNVPLSLYVSGIADTGPVTGTTTSISATVNLSPPPPVTNGAALVSYVQQFNAPPGAVVNFAYTVSGSGYAVVEVVSDCPATAPSCTPYSDGWVGSYPGAATSFNFQVTVGDSGMYTIFEEIWTGYSASAFTYANPSATITLNAGCGVGAYIGGNGTTQVRGVAFPAFAQTLTQAAQNCGYQGFDWQQWMTNSPCPSSVYPAVPGLVPDNLCPDTSPTPGSLQGPPGSPAVTDPPNGGYTYVLLPDGEPYNPYPFYYTVQLATTPNYALTTVENGVEGVAGPFNKNDTTLTFFDAPAEPCLPTGPLTDEQAEYLAGIRAEVCGGPDSTMPPGSFLGFTTSLVGIDSDGSAGPALYTFFWTDTFNGTVGGLGSRGPAQVDPGSGVGWITVGLINGVPVPPIVPPTQIRTTSSGLAYSRVTRTFDGTVTITNISDGLITTPTNFQIVLTALPTGVTLVNASGTFNMSPYITVPTVTSLAPGQSASVAVQFSNPSGVLLNYTPEVYAGTFQ